MVSQGPFPSGQPSSLRHAATSYILDPIYLSPTLPVSPARHLLQYVTGGEGEMAVPVWLFLSNSVSISSRVFPFVSGMKRTVKKYRTPNNAKERNRVPKPHAFARGRNAEASPHATNWLENRAIDMPLARMRVGISSERTSHTQTPGPNE